MRQLPHQHGEFHRTATESFGRIARQLPASGTGKAAHAASAANDRAVASNDAFACTELAFAERSALQLAAAARSDRAIRIGALVAAALSALGARARTLAERISDARKAHATMRALRDLDSRTLHDLGFHRSEILSVALAGGRDTATRRVRFARADSTLRLV